MRLFNRVSALAIAWGLLLGAIVPCAAQTVLPPVHNPANGHWYQVVRVPSGIHWTQARAAAAAMRYLGYSGHLVTITSAAEHQFVTKVVIGGLQMTYGFWLGGYQDTTAPDYREPDGGWRWITGEPWSYTHWGAGLPDNRGDENYLILHNDNDSWGDITESFGMDGYLVEYEPPAVPTTARIGILPNPVVGGMPTVGVVTLDRPAGPDDLVIPLASSNPAVAVVPTVVVVPAGSADATFSILTFPVPAATAVTLTASGPGGARPATLQVQRVGASGPTGNLLTNGSFEQPRVTPGAPDALTLRERDALPGWRITRGTVDLVLDPAWQSAPGEGTQALDLVGTPGAGTIEQSFATVPGREYLFSGWIAHHPDNPVAPEGRADVSLNGVFLVQLFHRDVRTTRTNLRWTHFAYQFRATAATTTLSIADVTNTWDMGGLFLDGLVVTPMLPNLLVNGSFEEPDLAAGGQDHHSVSQGELPGWQIAAGTVDVVQRRAWEPAPGQGSQSLHLLGSPGAAGAIEQSFATEPGRLYTLTGWVAHHRAIEKGRAQLLVDGTLLAQLYHSNALYGPASPSDMRWQPFLYTFRAAGPATTLQIVDGTGLSPVEGAVLDGLAVAPTEEPGPAPPPAAPTNLSARVISSTELDLAWMDNSTDETGFEIERRGSAGEWLRIAVLAPNSTRFSDFGVSPGSVYTYRVRALNDAAVSGWSNEASGTTPAGP